MNRHVDRYLTAYVEGQLNRRRARRVYRHVSECAACRDKLARHERLSADLRLALSHNPRPPDQQMAEWWRAIASPPRSPVSHGWLSSMLVPALVSLLLVLLPIVAGLGQPPVMAGAPGNTAISPVIDTTIAPPAEVAGTEEPSRVAAEAPSQTASATRQPDLTPATPAPAPLAP